MVEVLDLRKIGFLAKCTDAELRRLAPLCRQTAYRAGQSIHEEHVPVHKVFAILAGEVLLYRNSGGASAARLAVVKAGEMFGIGEALLPEYYTAANALTICTLLEIDKENFRQHFLAIPAFRDLVLTELSRMARFLICKVTGGGGRQDLALYLRTQAGRCGQTAPDGRIRLQQKQRQPEIASLLNLSREHVTRIFAKFKLEGVVDFNRGFPLIDRAWLDREAPDRDLAATVQYRNIDAGQ